MKIKILALLRSKPQFLPFSLFSLGLLVFGLSAYYNLFLSEKTKNNLNSETKKVENTQAVPTQGEIAGVQTETSDEIPTPTVTIKKTNTLSPTPTQQQNNNSNNQTNSPNNNNSSGNQSSPTPTPTTVPTQTFTPTQTLSPIPTVTPTPIPTPTNDGSLFDAGMTINSNHEAIIVANKPLRSCGYSYCTGSRSLNICSTGDGNINSNSCNFSFPLEGWLEYASVESIYGESKELH